MTNEIWKIIPQYENYEVSNLGRIKSKWFGKDKIMKVQVQPTGYIKVRIKGSNGISKSFRVHRLVAECFIPNPENKATVNHKDKNKANNTVPNLEWHTQLENAAHKVDFIRDNEALLNGLCDNCKAIIAKLLK